MSFKKQDDWTFGEILRYVTPKKTRRVKALFLGIRPNGKALIWPHDPNRKIAQSVPLSCLRRDPQLRPKQSARLRVIDAPVGYSVEVQYRTQWVPLTTVLNKDEWSVAQSLILRTLETAEVEVRSVRTPWDD